MQRTLNPRIFSQTAPYDVVSKQQSAPQGPTPVLRRAAATLDSRRSSFAPPTRRRRLPSRERYPAITRPSRRAASPTRQPTPGSSARQRLPATSLRPTHFQPSIREYSRHDFELAASAREEAASRGTAWRRTSAAAPTPALTKTASARRTVGVCGDAGGCEPQMAANPSTLNPKL